MLHNLLESGSDYYPPQLYRHEPRGLELPASALIADINVTTRSPQRSDELMEEVHANASGAAMVAAEYIFSNPDSSNADSINLEQFGNNIDHFVRRALGLMRPLYNEQYNKDALLLVASGVELADNQDRHVAALGGALVVFGLTFGTAINRNPYPRNRLAIPYGGNVVYKDSTAASQVARLRSIDECFVRYDDGRVDAPDQPRLGFVVEQVLVSENIYPLLEPEENTGQTSSDHYWVRYTREATNKSQLEVAFARETHRVGYELEDGSANNIKFDDSGPDMKLVGVFNKERAVNSTGIYYLVRHTAIPPVNSGIYQ